MDVTCEKTSLFELQTASCAGTLLQRRGRAACRARGILAFCRRGSSVWQGAFLIEQALPTHVHHGHDLGEILWPHAQVDAHGTGVALCLAGILAIENRRNVSRETCIENLLGFCDSCRNTGDDFRICQLPEGFVLGHASILAYVRGQV